MMERRRKEEGEGHMKVPRKTVVGRLEDTEEDKQEEDIRVVVDMLEEDMVWVCLR